MAVEGSLKKLIKLDRNFFYSPFRYPGGKTWLAPVIEKWLSKQVDCLVEPFAGGGSIGLTAASTGLAKTVHLVELDPGIAVVWQVMLNGQSQELTVLIKDFKLNKSTVNALLDSVKRSPLQKAFQTIIRNRVSRGGIMAEGAGLLKQGEDGKGLKSRWYPDTLGKRITHINTLREKITFSCGDGLAYLKTFLNSEAKTSLAFFIDPPYSTAGPRLYRYHKLAHEELFEIAGKLPGNVLMTYEDTKEVRTLATKSGLSFKQVPMKSVHHVRKKELLISQDLEWFNGR